MIQNFAVQLFRNTLVEAAVTSLHVEYRDFSALGRNHSQAGVGIAIQHQSVRFFGFHDFVGFFDHARDGLRCVGAHCSEEVIRLTDIQVIEENLVQFIVKVLPGVNQDVLSMGIELGNNPRHFDQLGTGPDNSHYFKH
ncbi:hypothetical protein D3C84_899950 [compost metagenome]